MDRPSLWECLVFALTLAVFVSPALSMLVQNSESAPGPVGQGIEWLFALGGLALAAGFLLFLWRRRASARPKAESGAKAAELMAAFDEVDDEDLLEQQAAERRLADGKR